MSFSVNSKDCWCLYIEFKLCCLLSFKPALTGSPGCVSVEDVAVPSEAWQTAIEKATVPMRKLYMLLALG